MRRDHRRILGIAAVFLLAPGVLFAAGVRSRVEENRAAVLAPSIERGWSAPADAADWAAQNVPLRQQMIDAAQWLDRNVFGGPGSIPRPAGTAPTDTPAAPWPFPGYPQVIRGKEGVLFFGGDFAQLCEPVRDVDQIVRSTADLAAAVQASGREFLLVVAPDKSAVLTDDLPGSPVGAECRDQRIADLEPQLQAMPYYVDLLPGLRDLARNSTTPVYLDVDTHWNGPAAAYLARAVAGQLAPGIVPSLTSRPQDEFTLRGDLSVLDGSTAQATYGPVLVASRTVRHAWAGVPAIDGTPRRYLSIGPAATQIEGRSLWLGDSFTLAAGATVPEIFTDLTELHVTTATSAPSVVLDQMVAADRVIVEVVQREFYNGASPILDPSFVEAAVQRLAQSPR